MPSQRARTRKYWQLMAAKAVLLWPEDCARILGHGSLDSTGLRSVLRSLAINDRVKTNRVRFLNALKKGAASHAVQARPDVAQSPDAGAVANVRLTANAIAAGYLSGIGK